MSEAPDPTELATTQLLPYLAVAGNEEEWRAFGARYRPRIQLLGEYVAVTRDLHLHNAAARREQREALAKARASTSTYRGIRIYVDPIGLQEAGKSFTSTVKIDFPRLPLRISLRLVLEQIGLTYQVRDGVLMITSPRSEVQPIEILADPVAGPTIIPPSNPGDSGMTGSGIGVASGVVGSGTTSIPAYGAALYRTGQFGESVHRLEERTKLLNGVEEPIDWPFLAMAHYRLGRRDEARYWLDRLRERQPSTNPDQFWDELAIRLLRSEAESVILYDPIFPADPFAH